MRFGNIRITVDLGSGDQTLAVRTFALDSLEGEGLIGEQLCRSLLAEWREALASVDLIVGLYGWEGLSQAILNEAEEAT